MLGVTMAAGLLLGSLSRFTPAETSSFIGVLGSRGGFFGVLPGEGCTFGAPDFASNLAASWRLFPDSSAARATWFEGFSCG